MIVHPVSHRGAARFHAGFAGLALLYIGMASAMLWFHLESSRRHWQAWQRGER